MAGSSVLELVSKHLTSVCKVGNCFSGFIDGEKHLDEFIRQLESVTQVSFKKIKSDLRQTATGNSTKRLPGEGWILRMSTLKFSFQTKINPSVLISICFTLYKAYWDGKASQVRWKSSSRESPSESRGKGHCNAAMALTEILLMTTRTRYFMAFKSLCSQHFDLIPLY